MNQYGYDAPCAPSLGRMYGLGLTPAQQRNQAAALARKNAALARQAVAKQKKLVKVAGKTVATSNPAAAAKVHQSLVAAQQQLMSVKSLAATAQRTKSKVDIQKALVAANSTGTLLKSMLPAPRTALRGFGDFGSCVQDPSNPANLVDNGDGQGCNPYGQQTGYPGVQTGYPQQYPQQIPGLNTGLVPGFGMPTGGSPFGAALYAPDSRCAKRPDLPNCVILQLEANEQSQFQFVFTIMQQMYAQLLTIVQQLMSQLQSAQQSPYAYGQQPAPYDPNNPYSQYGQQPYGQQPYGQPPYSPYGSPAYGGQYPGPGYPGPGYYAGGDTSTIPAGYDTGGGDIGVPGDITQVFPGPSSGGGGGYPIQSYGGPPPGLISSDSLPIGADQQSGDDAAGLIPSSGSGPNLPAPATQSQQQSAASTTAQPQIIVLQTGPGQSSYADASLPAGDRQNQPQLDAPEHDDLT